MDNSDFLKEVNKQRLNNKNQWSYNQSIVNGWTVSYKAFNTSIQIFRINNIEYGSTFDMKVSDFKKFIIESLEHHERTINNG